MNYELYIILFYPKYVANLSRGGGNPIITFYISFQNHMRFIYLGACSLIDEARKTAVAVNSGNVSTPLILEESYFCVFRKFLLQTCLNVRPISLQL